MFRGMKGKRIATTFPSVWGVIFILAFFTIWLALFVTFGHKGAFTARPYASLEALTIVLAFLVWFYLFWFHFRSSMIMFHERGFTCYGLEPVGKRAEMFARRKGKDSFFRYRDLDYAFLQIDRETDEGEVIERVRGRFIFKIGGRSFLYRARWVVRPESLDKLLIRILKDKYLGALVQDVD